MSTLDRLIDDLFGESNPGGYFLLSVACGILVLLIQEKIKSKMNEIARISDSTLKKDNAFTRVLLQSAEVWNDPEWRKLKFRHTLFGYLSVVAIVFGLWFGLTSLIIILGTLLGW
jgi:hypothetical protein